MVQRRQDARVLVVEGELDMMSSPQFRAALARLEQAHGELVVDLAGVSFMDLSGLRVLLGAYERARRRGMRLVLVDVSAGVRRLLALTGTTELLRAARPRE